MSGIEIREVAPQGLALGEGPHWDASRGCLLYVNITEGELHRLYTKTGRHQVMRVAPGEYGKTVSFVIPVEGEPDLYAIGHGRSVSIVAWPESDPDLQTKQIEVTLQTVDGHRPTNQFNDGKCDPQGRLWTGTLAGESFPGAIEPNQGNLYRVDNDLTLTRCVDKISISNGLGWSNERKTFYYIDSMKYAVDAFDYNDGTGEIGNRRTLLDFKKAGLAKDLPDGMCVDSNGDLWVACFSGAKVIRINPASQTITQTITLPASETTSVCFGGEDLATLFVTSGNLRLTPQKASQPAGATFAVTGLGVTGVPSQAFRINKEALKVKMEGAKRNARM